MFTYNYDINYSAEGMHVPTVQHINNVKKFKERRYLRNHQKSAFSFNTGVIKPIYL